MTKQITIFAREAAGCGELINLDVTLKLDAPADNACAKRFLDNLTIAINEHLRKCLDGSYGLTPEHISNHTVPERHFLEPSVN